MKPFEWFGSTKGVFDCLWLFWQVKTVWFEFMIWLKHWISFILRPHQYWLHTIYNTFFVCSFVYLAMDKVWNNISCCYGLQKPSRIMHDRYALMQTEPNSNKGWTVRASVKVMVIYFRNNSVLIILFHFFSISCGRIVLFKPLYICNISKNDI